MSSAKDAVAARATGAADVTRQTMQSSMDMTKGMVISGVQLVGHMVLSGVDTVLGKSEEWADNHLPMTDSELGECGPRASPHPDTPTQSPSV